MPNLPKKPKFSLVERRYAPRYVVDFPCRVATPEDIVVQGRISDFSLVGIQLKVNETFVQSLYPNFKRSDWRAPIKVKIDFSLPTSKQEATPISLVCQLVYCRRSQEHSFKVGCQYVEIDPQAQMALEDHIQYFGIPKNH